MLEIYAPLEATDVPFVITNVESSEMIKYASNGFLATKISFINEIAELCERVGADVEHGGARHGPRQPHRPEVPPAGPRLRRLLLPEGHHGLAEIAERARLTTSRSSTRCCRVNERVQPRHGRRRSRRRCGGLAGKTVAVLGLAFKPRHRRHARVAGDPDHRGAARARRARARVRPGGDRAARGRCCRAVELCDDAYEAARAPTRVVIATEWNEFRALDLDRLRQLAARAADRRPAQPLRARAHAAAGFRYVSDRPRRGRRPEGSRHEDARVVTGGAGFLGSHLCDRLLAEGTRSSAWTT